MDEMVQHGAVPALVKHLQAPPSGKGDKCAKFFQHKVETTSAYALRWLAAKVCVIADPYSKLLVMLYAIKGTHIDFCVFFQLECGNFYLLLWD